MQLGLNVASFWIFFGMHQPGWAYAEIVILWLAIVATTVAFFRQSKFAGWLMGLVQLRQRDELHDLEVERVR